MIQKLIYPLFLAWVAALLFVACDRDDASFPAETPQGEKIRFELIHPTAVAGPSGDAPQSRVVSGPGYTCQWAVGDSVSLYIVEGNKDLNPQGNNWADNVKMTYTASGWKYTLPHGKEYYPGGTTLSFYAFYPYVSNPGNNRYARVATDQSNGYDNDYLLRASKTGVSNSSQPVQLNFLHQHALVEISVINGGDGAKVGDIYPHKGLPMGVVFETSNGGKNGKIVSLVESSPLAWGPMGEETSARNQDDGQENMDIIKQLDSQFSNYPAFKWCADLGEGWYFPAANEVLGFLRKRTILNSTLDLIGGVGVEKSLYNTSTESNNDSMMVSVSVIMFLAHLKNAPFPVRAVRKF